MREIRTSGFYQRAQASSNNRTLGGGFLRYAAFSPFGQAALVVTGAAIGLVGITFTGL